ncbi:MAG: glycosyltransferase family 4 protein [Desulfovibrio sp.]
MKILLLDFGKNYRGGQRQVMYLAKHLKLASWFTPVIAAPSSAPLLKEAQINGIETVGLPNGMDLCPRNIFRLWRAIKDIKPAWVHTNDAKSASAAAFLKMLGGQFKLMHTRRVSYSPKGGWSLKKYTLADKVVCVSAEIRDVMVAGGIDYNKSDVVHSGIDPERYRKSKRGNSPAVIGMVGAFTEQKGHVVLMEALHALSKRENVPHWKAILVGDGPLLGPMQDLAEKYGIRDRITFTGYADGRRILPTMDVFVVPSVNGEGSSGAVKEAWVCQLPLIASDLDSNLELVQDGINGLTFTNRDTKGLADALEKVLTDEALAAELIANGNQRVKLFTDKAMSDSYMTIYRDK